MASLSLTAEDQNTLAEIAKKLKVDPQEITTLSLRGTLQYYRINGTLLFLTGDTHRCHGCRFLEIFQTDTSIPPKVECNVIPFRDSNKPA